MVQATAPGKIILFGEHAVVYGYPAIAAPVTQVRATATIQPNPGAGIHLMLPDLGKMQSLLEAAADDALALAIHLVQKAAGLPELPEFSLTVTSTIPIASGLGSGAAVTAAAVRALALFLNRPDLAQNEQVSTLTYEVERIHHGTPSGIDNTVVSYEQPVYFVRQQPRNRIEPFLVRTPLRILVGDTGVGSPTKLAVGDVRRQWEQEPDQFNALFAGCGRIADLAREAIEQGQLARLGELMGENHTLLREMTVSSAELDRLVAAACEAGALGAKLSGGGQRRQHDRPGGRKPGSPGARCPAPGWGASGHHDGCLLEPGTVVAYSELTTISICSIFCVLSAKGSRVCECGRIQPPIPPYQELCYHNHIFYGRYEHGKRDETDNHYD